jgi:hypothetical protein
LGKPPRQQQQRTQLDLVIEKFARRGFELTLEGSLPPVGAIVNAKRSHLRDATRRAPGPQGPPAKLVDERPCRLFTDAG